MDSKGRSKKEIILEICDSLKSNVRKINKDYCKGKSQFGIRTSSLESNLLLIDYLTKFPLFSSKFMNYSDFKTVVFMIKDKIHKSDIAMTSIIAIRNTMNNKRTLFV